MMRRALAWLVVCLALAAPAAAVQPDEMLDDPVLEKRARDISANLRCVVCQNESIDDSNAELARDMRVLVRQRLLAGDSDQQVIQFIVDRYGDFVLLKPPFKAMTYVLWFGPGVLALIALGIGVGYYRGRAREGSAASPARDLSEDERRRLEALLAEEREEKKP